MIKISLRTLGFCLAQALLAAAVCLPAGARVLNICDDVADPLTLDPLKQFSDKNYTLCWQIFDGLVRFSPDGKIEPALAVSWEKAGPDRLRFHLREGVVFHNGEPFDAEAVRFSIARYVSPETGFPGYYFIDSISHAEVVSRSVVDIVTRHPDALLLNRLAGLVLMLPPKYLTEKGPEYFAEHPVGTGAFVFKEWEKGRLVSFAANKAYWMRGFPKVEGLTFNFIPYEKQVDALLSGAVDLLTDLPGTRTLQVKGDPRLAVLKKPSFYTMPVALRLSSGPLSDMNVRKALNHALNKENLIRYDLLGNGIPVSTLSMPGEAGHNRDLKPYRYDPPLARRLLAQAGFPKGLTLQAVIKRNAERAAKIIVSDLKKIGVLVQTTVVPDAELISAVKSGKYDMIMGSSPDPMCHAYFIQAIVLASGSPFAVDGDAKFDELLVEMVSAPDDGASLKKAEALDAYVYRNAMSIFTYQKTRLYGLDKTLSFSPYLSGMPCFYSAEFSGRDI
ncbi:MAG: hypothetical protein A2X32_05890 [Elusimicrobia bacterium GWC2_64_44]|nr:MAG: hypothetical protein A2X32_05890 [Elusimicrobia bacterium GWC2_64_44]